MILSGLRQRQEVGFEEVKRKDDDEEVKKKVDDYSKDPKVRCVFRHALPYEALPYEKYRDFHTSKKGRRVNFQTIRNLSLSRTTWVFRRCCKRDVSRY